MVSVSLEGSNLLEDLWGTDLDYLLAGTGYPRTALGEQAIAILNMFFFPKDPRFQPLRSITDVLHYSTAQADRKTLLTVHMFLFILIYSRHTKTKQNKQKSNNRVNILFWHNVFLDTLKFKTSEKDPFSTEKLSVCKFFF